MSPTTKTAFPALPGLSEEVYNGDAIIFVQLGQYEIGCCNGNMDVVKCFPECFPSRCVIEADRIPHISAKDLDSLQAAERSPTGSYIVPYQILCSIVHHWASVERLEMIVTHEPRVVDSFM